MKKKQIVVKYIFEQYSLGKVTSVIAEELKQNNILRHNKPLTTDFLVKIIK